MSSFVLSHLSFLPVIAVATATAVVRLSFATLQRSNRKVAVTVAISQVHFPFLVTLVQNTGTPNETSG